MAQRTTVAAPLINNRRKFRCPIFEVFPSRALPPVECCRGVSPIHAEKSLPRTKVSTGGANASRAGDCHQPFGDIIFSCSPGDLLIKFPDPVDQRAQRGNHGQARKACWLW